MTTASRRLATDAKLVLERAGYICSVFSKPWVLAVDGPNGAFPAANLEIISGTVDNAEVEKLLERARRRDDALDAAACYDNAVGKSQ